MEKMTVNDDKNKLKQSTFKIVFIGGVTLPI